MPDVAVNGLRLHYAASGQGDPIVFVHGSFDDHRSWDHVVAQLDPGWHAIRYDRRGHGASECPPGQGRISEDVSDLAAVIERLEVVPAHLVGHSYGATIAVLLAVRYPGHCRSLTIHEPPLFGLLTTSNPGLLDDVQRRMRRAVEMIAGDEVEAGTRMFVDTIGFGEGTWDHILTEDLRQTFVAHAHTWLDQAKDPDRLSVGIDQLATIKVPTLITHGDQSLPWYGPLVRILAETIPASRSLTIAGCAHAPHLTHPREFASAIDRHR